ncbi:protein HOTHEAD-like [Apium graveolens]|uniref:protein HOTHEAD-like n=1 Tax=Apium graveolens TaxID=4045 RepID=UPI003D79DBE8
MGFVHSWILLNCAAIILLLPSLCYPETAPYSTFARDATAAPQEAYYDYIVIGGGTSGCALAATLSQGSKVLLLERGGLPYGNPTISDIRGFALTLADISHSSPSQLFVSTDGVINHRARILGGGTAINAGFYSRASSDFVARAGWDPQLVKESYEWVEKKIVFEPEVKQWQSAVRDGLLEAGVLPNNGFTFDHLIGTKIGGSIFDKNGHRHSAADLLEYAHPSNISVHLHAIVQRIMFISGAKPKANGVVFEDSNGMKHWAYINNGSNNEIIVSAGALGSPQLLMLSGIGPADHLEANGVEVILDQAMVGQGMADNPLNALIVPSTEPLETSLPQTVGITAFGSYIESLSGIVEFGWANSLPPELLNQSKQVNKMTRQQESPEVKAAVDSYLASNLQVGILLEKVMGPASSGHLELKTLDAKDNPKVTFNYFKDPQDLHKCVKGMETVIQVVESKAVSKFRYRTESVKFYMDFLAALPLNLRFKHLTTTFSLEQYCKDTVMTIWHYHGGCHVYKVVDHDYKVLGVDALRVIDGSTFPFDSPGTNPQATVMMLGRYMGQRIILERSS